MQKFMHKSGFEKAVNDKKTDIFYIGSRLCEYKSGDQLNLIFYITVFKFH